MSSENKAEKKANPDSYRIPRGSGWANAWKLAAAVGAFGVVLSAVAWANDPHRFAFSWLFAFITVLAVALGSLFFVIIQHMSGASWSVSWRRVPEIFASGLPVFALLFLPVVTSIHELYPWVESYEATASEAGAAEHASGEALLGASVARAQDHAHAAAEGAEASHDHASHHTPQHALHEETIEAKLAFLNPRFFYVRAAIYFAIWILLGVYYSRRSTEQDKKRDFQSTKTLQSLSPIATVTFSLSLTFAAFDWIMSLEPAWYSTIFGVQYFSVAAVAGLATIIVVTFSLKNAGILGEAVHVEHFHDLGKLLFGFLVFWAYISFSQFMLIWYASIPEETTYYHLRWAGGWQAFSIITLGIGHFGFPFFFMISRNVKRRVSMLHFAAAWLLVMHVLEGFWLVMPYANDGAFSVHWMDVATLLAVGGVYLAVVFFRMTQLPLIPIGDPRLARSLRHEVV